MLWHQGESNAGVDADADLYISCFLNIHGALRSYGVVAPIYVAQATICNSPPNETIRSAQRAVVDQGLGIFAGPDTDAIGLSHRYDGCYMAESGLIKHAELWAKAALITDSRVGTHSGPNWPEVTAVAAPPRSPFSFEVPQ